MNKVHIVLTGILCITILEAVALMNGINGIALTAVVGTICTTVGYMIPNRKVK